MKQIVSNLKQLIFEGKSAQAIALAKHGLSVNEFQFLTELRKNGIFRCSTYDFQFQNLQPLIDEVLSEKTISDYARNYFNSVKLLTIIGRSVQRIFKDLIKELDQGTFKSYLVSLDALFWEIEISNGIHSNSSRFSLSREEIASAFSFLFFQANEKHKIDTSQLNEVDIKSIRDKYFLNKLSNFHKITEFREIEILVDYFEYKVTRRNNKIVVEAPDEKFEMSISLGYINSQNQNIADSISSIMEQLDSGGTFLTKVCLELAIKLKNEIFHVKNNPTKRIVMKFSSSDEIFKVITNNNLFAEEEIIINLISKELFLDLSQIKQIKFYKDLSLFDVIKFQRFFAVLFHAFFAYVSSENLTNSKLFWRSILPVFKKDELLTVLGYFFEKTKVTQLLELLTWDSSSANVFDIQYQPILGINEWRIIPIGILSKSHLARNALQSTRYRFDSEASDDPIGKILEDALKPISSFVQRNFSYSFNGRKAEIDVIAVIDNHLFVFECKNSLHPTSPFELRTSYDYIKKGSNQLSYFSAFWEEETFIDYIATKTKTKSLTTLHTCIVTGNRMFSGWKEQGHSIRTIYELQNFISSGKISAQLLDLDVKTLDTQAISLWKGTVFSADDLVDYIDKDSLHNLYFDSMIKTEAETSFGNIKIVQYKYNLDATNFLQKVFSKFRLISTSD